DIYANNPSVGWSWLRTGGGGGWFNETFGGGWYMSDSTWIRSYGSKPVYMSNGLDTGGASGIGCGGGLGGGYMLQVCGHARVVNSLRTGVSPASPTAELFVVGSGDFNGHIYVGGTGYSYGGWTTFSDRRLKKNIQDIPFSGLETIGKLRPVSFEWKKPSEVVSTGKQLGFIAQEVEQVLPQLVKEETRTIGDALGDKDWVDKDEKVKTLNTDGIIPILVKAVQELQVRNDRLCDELTSLRKEVEAKNLNGKK
ncbi:MAG: tail fiber domain-containing protein, partial [Rickettsiales bacterium]